MRPNRLLGPSVAGVGICLLRASKIFMLMCHVCTSTRVLANFNLQVQPPTTSSPHTNLHLPLFSHCAHSTGSIHGLSPSPLGCSGRLQLPQRRPARQTRPSLALATRPCPSPSSPFQRAGWTSRATTETLATNLEAPLSVESIMNDIDTGSRLTREQLESLSADVLQRIEPGVPRAIADSGLTFD